MLSYKHCDLVAFLHKFEPSMLVGGGFFFYYNLLKNCLSLKQINKEMVKCFPIKRKPKRLQTFSVLKIILLLLFCNNTLQLF